MSYFDSLVSWKQAGDAIDAHRQTMEKTLNDGKATDIEDKYQHINNVINEAGGSIGGFSGAYHLTRKVYKKIKEGKAKVQEAKDTFEDLKSKGGQAKTDIESRMSGGKAKPESIEGMGDGSKPAEDLKTSGGGEIQAEPKSAVPVEEPPINESGDYASRATARVMGDNSASHTATESNQDLNPQGKTKAPDEPVGEAGESEKIVGGDIKNNIMGGLENMGDDLKDNVIKKVGSIASKGLEEASGVLEFLGPIGEVVGAGVALGGLFRNIFEHKKIKSEEAKAGAGRGDLVETAGGMSENNLASASKLSSTVGTIL
jgi:hypothetical protein